MFMNDVQGGAGGSRHLSLAWPNGIDTSNENPRRMACQPRVDWCIWILERWSLGFSRWTSCYDTLLKGAQWWTTNSFGKEDWIPLK